MELRKSILAGIVLMAPGLAACHAVGRSRDVPDYKNAEYVIEGRPIRLTDGVSKIAGANGSAALIETRYFGNEVRKDLNGDGREDVAFLVTQQTGGTGTFYYVVAALATETGYAGSHGLFLGDRIAPQTTEPGEGKQIIVNYADRAAGEPMTARPSVGKSIWLLLNTETMQFGEVVQNFEGEADPSRMTLGMKTWNWISATRGGKEIVPKQSGQFTLTFSDDERFSATTDCNSMGGSYTAKDGMISFGDIFSTKMFCQDSQETEFSSLLAAAQSCRFTSKGEFILTLEDGGTALFR